jgi:hypothetical protein
MGAEPSDIGGVPPAVIGLLLLLAVVLAVAFVLAAQIVQTP